MSTTDVKRKRVEENNGERANDDVAEKKHRIVERTNTLVVAATAGNANVPEPLLDENEDRFIIGSRVDYPVFKEFYLQQQAALWRSSEIRWEADRREWEEKLDDAERHFLSHVFVYFAKGDGVVGENIAMRFYTRVQDPWARLFYGVQLYIEGEHARTYSDLILALFADKAERERLFHAVDTLPAVKSKVEWAKRWTASDAPFGELVVAYAAMEGIHFSSCFCGVFFMRKRGLLPGVCQANDLIARDEGLHRDFGGAVLAALVNKPSEARIHEIVQSAVDVELEFVRDALPEALAGLSVVSMSQYVHFVADRLCELLCVATLYNVTNPFPWMDLISCGSKGNFFERPVTEYQSRLVKRVFSLEAAV